MATMCIQLKYLSLNNEVGIYINKYININLGTYTIIKSTFVFTIII